MNEPSLTYDTVVDLVLRLSRADRARLIAQVAPTLVEDTAVKPPKQSSYGILADLTIDLSAADIDEARREMWKNFPREDIGR